MAVFVLNEQMKVKTLQKQFKKKYGATLRVYKGMHFAEEATLLKDLSETAHPIGRLELNSKVIVSDFEKKFMDAFGVKVQVANHSNTQLAKNDITVHKAGRNL